MREASVSRSFDDSLTMALEAGRNELANLASISDRVIAAYRAAGAAVDRGEGVLLGDFATREAGFTGQLADHLDKQADVLSTFNIAFFGRTGAGKSTLLSAFGEMDGAAVSPGECDWTTEVGSIQWRGCRLYDTPGINGWGGRKSRDELEAAAREAVEIADVVLLCFDTQSQQATEFVKVANWVMHFGKPVVAVLNVRNPRWRHPARVPSQAARRNMSEPVAQHAENIRAELAGIGLNDVPVVAISSRRALFARAATPYRGPQEQNFADDRGRYGVDYLARWSNFSALEGVLTACIAAGGSQLRLKSLREGVRALLRDEASSLAQLRVHAVERADALDREIRRYLEVLGYLEDAQRGAVLGDPDRDSDLLTLAESARRAPYRAPADGSLVRQVRNLLKPHLTEARNNTLLRFKDLEKRAFRERTAIDPEAFVREVFREAEITEALERVVEEATSFLQRELSLAGVELRPRGAEYGNIGVAGDAGDTAGVFADVLRGSGLAGGLAAIAVPLLFSNPLGWAAVAAGIGVGAAAGGLQWLGEGIGKSAAREKAEARAKAARLGRKVIHDTFDTVERDFVQDANTSAWAAAVPILRGVMAEFVSLTGLRDAIDELAGELSGEASAIAQTEPFQLLDVTAHLTDKDASGSTTNRVERLLLGEDWFDHEVRHQDSEMQAEFDRICQQRNQLDAVALSGAMAGAFTRPDARAVAEWCERAASAAASDDGFGVVVADAAERRRPAVVVAGDYSAGKSSFIKRMITEFGGSVPDSLHVRADATTAEVQTYSLGPIDIIDTPGFQSRRTGHDELAVAGVGDAALVIVLLHVNLLIGDTTALQAITHGTPTSAGKWPRMLFVVNRCDEIGVDPMDSVEEFFHRRDRKCTELKAALESRGISVSLAHIHGVAADPFGGIGARLQVAAADYDANRAWDGVAPLVDSLLAWAGEDLTHASAVAAFDGAFTQLLTLRELTRSSMSACRAETGKHDSLIASMDICLQDASYLSQSLEHDLAETLDRAAARAIGEIRRVPVGEVQQLSEARLSWRSSETEAEFERVINTATVKVNDWAATHQSAIRRDQSGVDFDAKFDLPGAEPIADGSDLIGRVTGVAGAAAKWGSKLGKVLGNREAALKIGHMVGHKFKPWGAVKAGRAVGRAGVVLGVAASAAEAAAWVNQVSKMKDWETKRDAAVEDVESQIRACQRELVDDPDGVWRYLAERAAEVRDLRDQYLDRRQATEDESERLQQRLALADDLVNWAEEIRKVSVDG